LIYDLFGSFSLANYAGEYYWFLPTVETLHYTGHILLFGCILLFDLRLIGLAKRISLRQLESITVRYSMLGFAVAVLSGTALLLTDLDHFWGNPALVVKMILMALALINIFLFHFLVSPRLIDHDVGKGTPYSAKISGGASLLLWIGVISSGRLIAYF
jgi:hypothetical protein